VKTILVVCTHNAGRSVMAEAFLRRQAPSDIRVESAGSEPRREGVWPNVIEAMREVGIDVSAHRPRKLAVETQLHADWAVTLACGQQCPFVPAVVEDWDIPDPAGKGLEETRAIRDAIEVRVKDLLENRIDAIRTDRTAHQRRLQALLPGLVEKFAGRRSDAEIRLCADAVLTRFDAAPIRSHVLTLAHRQTCECLSRETCDALAVA